MTKRLFLAIELPDEMRRVFFEWQENYGHLRGVKWVPAENLHVTVEFYGDVEEDKIPELVDRIVLKPFELEFKEIVLAPPNRPPRMIWADFGDYHVTLARFKQPIYLSGLKQPEIKERKFEVDSVQLMESELTPERPYYKIIESIKL